MNNINIVFMGTPDFAVPTLEKLYNDKNISISYVITKPDAKSNRGQKISFSAVKEKALEFNLPILQPLSIKEDEFVIRKIKNANPDFIVVVAYGQILSKEILEIPKNACINGHASLLPLYRGASPIQSAILNGDKTTGTTTMLMNEGLDTGDILEQSMMPISENETSHSLFSKLSFLTADVMCHTINNFEMIKPIKQDEDKATKSVIIKKEYGKINLNEENSIDIERKIRAYNSWPSAFIENNNEKYLIWDADVCNDFIDLSKGKEFINNVYVIENKMYAKCKDGILKINTIQKSGKNKMSVKDFINGLKI